MQVHKGDPIKFINILQQNEGVEAKDDASTDAYALAVENISTTNVQKKVVSRVALVNEKGQRVLDTLVKPQELQEGESLVIKEGLKTELMKLGQEQGPTLELIRELITDLVKDKKVMGYHLPNKLNDLGMLKEFPKNGLLQENMHDIAKIFNTDATKQL